MGFRTLWIHSLWIPITVSTCVPQGLMGFSTLPTTSFTSFPSAITQEGSPSEYRLSMARFSWATIGSWLRPGLLTNQATPWPLLFAISQLDRFPAMFRKTGPTTPWLALHRSPLLRTHPGSRVPQLEATSPAHQITIIGPLPGLLVRG